MAVYVLVLVYLLPVVQIFAFLVLMLFSNKTVSEHCILWQHEHH